METQTLEPEVLTPTIIPVAELEKINATDAGFLKIKSEIDDYLASGAMDERANDITQLCVKVRTGSLKLAKELAAPYGQKYDEIMSYGKSLGDRAKALEDRIRPVKDAFEAEKERIKREKAEAEAAKIAARIDDLYEIGAKYNGLTYEVFGVFIDVVEVKALPDSEYVELYRSAVTAFVNEKQRLAEQKRLADEHAELVAAEQKAEQQRQAVIAEQQEAERLRLQKIADEQAEQQRQFEEKQAEFNRQQREVENRRLQEIADKEKQERKIEADKEAERQRILLESRIARLVEVGFEDQGQRLDNADYSLDKPSIQSLEDQAFDIFIQGVVDLNQQKAEQERFNCRLPQLLEAGFKMDGDAEMYSNVERVISAEDICTLPDNEFDVIIKQAVKVKNLADKERSKRLAKDKNILTRHFNKIAVLSAPELSQIEAVEFWDRFEKRYADLICEFNGLIPSL